MLFSSITFLWFFLPLVFLVHLVLPKKLKNVFLLIASFLFYSWGEPVYILLMLTSIVVNYVFALCIQGSRNRYNSEGAEDGGTKLFRERLFLVLAILFNIGLLWYFKYYQTFSVGVNALFRIEVLPIKEIVLPLGISFYTFQILSYVIDVYRRECKVQHNLIHFALYVSFFPQLVAGPIVKYKDIARQIESRKLNETHIAYGIKRFIYGLSKKVILSNTIAAVADRIFAVSIDDISTIWLWIGTALYTLQIYYDFSGYSDMAIGLGRMFGFEFAENFNYPYVSVSIQEFWRRWHISLSSWFKEYVYIPLGGNRKGKRRTILNLAIVFVITGIWHGASLNFLLWGCFHGFFSLLERGRFGELLRKNRLKVFNHFYTMLVVGIGWAIFRCDSLRQALQLLKHMFKWQSNAHYVWYDFFSIRSIFVIAVGVLLVGFIQERFMKIRNILYDRDHVWLCEGVWQMILLSICVILLIGGQYNPFIYFKF